MLPWRWLITSVFTKLSLLGAATPEESADEAEVVEKRLWLYGTLQSSPGLIGLFRTARTEPLGERLRMICDATHPGPGGTWSLDQMPVEGAPRARFMV